MGSMGSNAGRHPLHKELKNLLESICIWESYYSPLTSTELNLCVCLRLLKEQFAAGGSSAQAVT